MTMEIRQCFPVNAHLLSLLQLMVDAVSSLAHETTEAAVAGGLMSIRHKFFTDTKWASHAHAAGLAITDENFETLVKRVVRLKHLSVQLRELDPEQHWVYETGAGIYPCDRTDLEENASYSWTVGS